MREKKDQGIESSKFTCEVNSFLLRPGKGGAKNEGEPSGKGKMKSKNLRRDQERGPGMGVHPA